MTERTGELATGILLLTLAVIWSVIVLKTIPAGAGGGDIGPRAFPLLLGVLLGLFSLGLLARALWGRPEDTLEQPSADAHDVTGAERIPSRVLVPLFLTLGHIVVYGFLMQRIGFALATLVLVASAMVFCVGERSPWRITAMSIGVTFACWLVFAKILGVYLAVGSWINLG